MRIKTHPGEILKEEYMVPLGISARQLGRDLSIQHTRITAIVNEERSVTADTAIRLARYFDTTPTFWSNLQAQHDLSKEQNAHAGEYDAIKTLAYT